MGKRRRPSICHQGRVFPSQSRKAPEVSCERLASTVRMPCTLCSTIRGACRRGQGTVSLLWADLAWKSARLGQTGGCMAWGAALTVLMGVFFLTIPPHSLFWGGGDGTQDGRRHDTHDRAGYPMHLACCSLLPAPCLLCPRGWYWQPTASHNIRCPNCPCPPRELGERWGSC